MTGNLGKWILVALLWACLGAPAAPPAVGAPGDACCASGSCTFCPAACSLPGACRLAPGPRLPSSSSSRQLLAGQGRCYLQPRPRPAQTRLWSRLEVHRILTLSRWRPPDPPLGPDPSLWPLPPPALLS
ncbi:MAG TPA: hypothetical protein VNO81_03065 [Candidatus Nitrosotenuis sp.]|nr:hypothetical protein [Candidatus Nitrosotenuis sp.]